MRLSLIIVIISSFFTLLEAKHWALIVAGSNGWYNYRHQADACHAYQILHKHGIPDENIVTMMYDDIAHNTDNPNPGVIINKPNGPNVYSGVVKDYTRFDVNSDNFINILIGNKTAMRNIGSGKVIDSGPDDNIFVYFTDHGAPGIVAFPSGELSADELQTAILYMHSNQRYKQMVFYIEACESGSMFNRHQLPSDIDVFATTAANGEESSYACYYDKKLNTYLGDVYSVRWLEDSDKAKFQSETLQQQFKMVKKETNTSHVLEFGDLSMGSLTIGHFQGDGNTEVSENSMSTPFVPITDAVPSPEVPTMILYHSIRNAKTAEEKEYYQLKLEKEMKMRENMHRVVRHVVKQLVFSENKRKRILTKKAKPTDHVCYKAARTEFKKSCFNFNKHEHALRHVYVFANLCDMGIPIHSISKAIIKACPVAY